MSSNKRNGEFSESTEAKRVKSNGTPIKSNQPAGPVSKALQTAIKTAQPNRMISVILSLCETNPQLVKQLSEIWLVKGKEVVPYHADNESENDGEESDAEIERMKKPKSVKATGGEAESGASKSIMVGPEDFTAKYAICRNCTKEFDVTVNERGMCRWHTGRKHCNYENDFWADHDENCHGRIEDFEDDEDMQEGFLWSCCEKDGSNKGCKSTKHKANANQVIS